MAGFPILSAILALPLLGALACLLSGANGARWIALITTLATFLLCVGLWAAYRVGGPQWQFTEYHAVFGRFAWALGIDGIALMLIVLTAFLMPVCIAASWKSIQSRVPEFMANFLLMETLMIGVFCAQDLYLFYIFFEAGLIPMYLIIGIWGGKDRIYAAYKFFLYTLLGSVLMLVAMLWMVNFAHTTFIPDLMATDFPPEAQTWLWLAFFASFAVKMPMWPVHTWLPDAHVQAPTAGSVILAGVLLKMGGYGFVRFSLPMFPEASAQLIWIVFGLSMVAVVYTSLVALVQQDMKKLIAYSSVAHMAFVTIGLFAFNRQGIEGGLIVMLSHGLVSGALFLCVGVIYDRLHSREIAIYGGLSNNMPRYALLFMVFTMASRSAPPAPPTRRRWWTSAVASLPSSRRSPPPCCGWASIRKASSAPCAPTSICSSPASSAPRRRATPSRPPERRPRRRQRRRTTDAPGFPPGSPRGGSEHRCPAADAGRGLGRRPLGEIADLAFDPAAGRCRLPSARHRSRL
jgi:NADH-quinone oxidoreductase subunit M